MIVYANTEANEKSVGWWSLPEYCLGDRSAKFVLHDTSKGVFIFTDLPRGWYVVVYDRAFVAKTPEGVIRLVEGYESTCNHRLSSIVTKSFG